MILDDQFKIFKLLGLHFLSRRDLMSVEIEM
jgi:hypothetical protein